MINKPRKLNSNPIPLKLKAFKVEEMRDFIETFKSLWYFYPGERWLLIPIAPLVLLSYGAFIFLGIDSTNWHALSLKRHAKERAKWDVNQSPSCLIQPGDIQPG